jgi:hypothetical protein
MTVPLPLDPQPASPPIAPEPSLPWPQHGVSAGA